MNGLSTAINEITLVLFTTLAPSGALAYALMNLRVLFGDLSESDRRRLNRFSCLPLAITMVGLIASATHLGNPANALYVFAGVGRSPLSTEVFCAVIFLALAGIYWLYSFAEVPRIKLQRILLIITDISALLFVVATAYAYNVSTIPTWNLPLVPVSLLLNAFVGGPVVTLFCFAATMHTSSSSLANSTKANEASEAPTEHADTLDSKSISPSRNHFLGNPTSAAQSHSKLLLGTSIVALILNVLVYALIGLQLSNIGNELTTATELIPCYPLFVIAFVTLAATGITVSWRFEKGTESQSLLFYQGIAAALVLAAIFLMRFSFYMSHLTIGLGV